LDHYQCKAAAHKAGGNSSVKAQVARQAACCAVRECKDRQKTITRIGIVMLRHIHLGVCWQNTAYNGKAQPGKNEPGTRLVVAAWLPATPKPREGGCQGVFLATQCDKDWR
jgi:hypothetical protein